MVSGPFMALLEPSVAPSSQMDILADSSSDDGNDAVGAAVVQLAAAAAAAAADAGAGAVAKPVESLSLGRAMGYGGTRMSQDSTGELKGIK